MSTVNIATGATELICAQVLSVRSGAGLTGAASTVKISVRRASDGKYIDWADNTFKSSGWTTRQASMTEADSVNEPGLYTHSLNTSSIVSPVANDVYTVFVEQVGAATAINLPQMGEIRVGSFVDVVDSIQSDTNDIQTRLPAALVAGRIDASVGAMASNVVTSTSIAAGAITSSKFAANALGAVWDELEASHVTASTFGALIGTNLDATVSSRLASAAYTAPPSVGAIASQVWSTALPGAFTAGQAGYYLDAAVSSRLASASYTAPPSAATIASQVDSTLTGSHGSGTWTAAAAWDALVSAHATANTFGSLVQLTLDGTIAGVPAAVWSYAARSLTTVAGLGIATQTSVDAAQADITAIKGAGFVSGTDDLHTLHGLAAGAATASGLSSAVTTINAHTDSAVAPLATSAAVAALPTASQNAVAVVDQALSGHTSAGTVGEALGRVDVAVSTRLAAASYVTPPTVSAISTQVASDLATAHGAGSWASVTVASGGITSSSLAVSAISAIQSGLATSANVSASETAIRGVQSLDLSLLGGAAFNTAVDSLAAAAADRAVFLQALGDVQNSTTFSATMPILVRPVSGTTAYVILVNIENTSGVPTDPDANTITVGVQNGAGTDRSANLSSTTMTRLGVGRYEVSYDLASNATLEQLIFTFSYAQSAVPYAKDRTSTVVDSATTDFTSSDRATLGAILTDTSAIEPLVSANLDQSISSAVSGIEAHGDAAWTTATGFAVPGDAMALTLSERTSVSTSVWSSVTRTLTSVVLDAGSLTSSVIGSGYLAAVSGQVAADLAGAHGAGSWATATSVSIASSGLGASSLTAGAIAAIQAGLATSSAVSGVPAAVWATAEGGAAGSMGAALSLLRRRQTNKRVLSSAGVVTFYDDANVAEATVQLLDVNGAAVSVQPGDPARSSKEA